MEEQIWSAENMKMDQGFARKVLKTDSELLLPSSSHIRIFQYQERLSAITSFILLCFKIFWQLSGHPIDSKKTHMFKAKLFIFAPHFKFQANFNLRWVDLVNALTFDWGLLSNTFIPFYNKPCSCNVESSPPLARAGPAHSKLYHLLWSLSIDVVLWQSEDSVISLASGVVNGCESPVSAGNWIRVLCRSSKFS